MSNNEFMQEVESEEQRKQKERLRYRQLLDYQVLFMT
jgi:hypothetical protein